MFHKKYKVKTSTALKNSDRKKLKTLIEVQLCLPVEEINSLISSKAEITQTKALTHSNAVVTIYNFSNTPLFFMASDKIFPTVYLLWRFPNIIPTLITTSFVLDKIQNGADLMAPGIIIEESNMSEFEKMKVDDVVAIRIYGNMAPIAVGTAAISSSDLIVEGCKGKAVFITHSYKDNLWSSCDPIHLPLIPELIPQEIIETDSVQENFENVTIADNSVPNLDTFDNRNSANVIAEDVVNDEKEDTTVIDAEITPALTMDEILHLCFMTFLKMNGKKITLPILTSTFYTHVLACCPVEFNLDIKKTTFKKLSVFLKSMSKTGMIALKELTKGVESIVSVNLEHESLLAFRPTPLFLTHLKQQKEDKVQAEKRTTVTVQNNYEFPVIVEMFMVSGKVKALFETAKIKKGEALTGCQVREILRDYVKQNSLQDERNPRMVTLDPILSHSLLKNNDCRTSLSWEDLQEMTVSLMNPAFEVTFTGEQPKLKKGHIDPIDISVATRTGNKKVTLIINLENFGINPDKLANYVQVAVAASTSVGLASNGKGTQVLIQGNQLRYLQSLFFDIYKVPRKFVRGLDNIPPKKKK